MSTRNNKFSPAAVRRWFPALTASLCAAASILPGQALSGNVSGTGLNNFKQTAAPASLTSDVTLVAGREFSLALKSNGTVAGWGHPGEDRAKPPANLSGVISLSAGIYHTLALKADGSVTGWGFNGDDILSIPPDLPKALAVAAGGYHSLALLRDGTVIGWGHDGNGRATVPADLRDVIAIDAGRDHSVALKSNGTVVAWGLNDDGQTDVPADLADVRAIAAGENHTLALKNDGTVVAWGWNDAGQTDVPAGLTDVVAIAAGAQHSLALRADGSVQGWGDNSKKQLNLTGSNIRGVAAGGYHTLVVRGTGPLITAPPKGESLVAGSKVTFTATATGSGLTYQWQFNGEDIAGATGSTLVVDNAGRVNGGVYTVKVTDENGFTTSSNTVLVVRGRLKTALQMLAGGAVRLVFSDEFGDPIRAANAGRYRVQVSEDLQTWRPLNQPVNLMNGKLRVEDPDAGQVPRRYYRAIEN